MEAVPPLPPLLHSAHTTELKEGGGVGGAEELTIHGAEYKQDDPGKAKYGHDCGLTSGDGDGETTRLLMVYQDVVTWLVC